jgi:hypothetical protein
MSFAALKGRSSTMVQAFGATKNPTQAKIGLEWGTRNLLMYPLRPVTSGPTDPFGSFVRLSRSGPAIGGGCPYMFRPGDIIMEFCCIVISFPVISEAWRRNHGTSTTPFTLCV